jgi:hypothetical protein
MAGRLRCHKTLTSIAVRQTELGNEKVENKSASCSACFDPRGTHRLDSGSGTGGRSAAIMAGRHEQAADHRVRREGDHAGPSGLCCSRGPGCHFRYGWHSASGETGICAFCICHPADQSGRCRSAGFAQAPSCQGYRGRRYEILCQGMEIRPGGAVRQANSARRGFTPRYWKHTPTKQRHAIPPMPAFFCLDKSISVFRCPMPKRFTGPCWQ